MNKLEKYNLKDYDFENPDNDTIVKHTTNYWDSSDKKDGDWPGLSDDSYVWDSLKRYGNTCIGYRHGIALLKHFWHMQYSKHTPSNFMTSKKYSKKYKNCINAIEKYISERIGKNVRMRLVEGDSNIEKCHPYYSVTNAVYIDDFWILECKK